MNCNQCDYLRGEKIHWCELDGTRIATPNEHICINFQFETRFVGLETDEEKIAKENLFYE